MTKPATLIRLGFAVGTGMPVDVPLAHTFVTGQTQLSGKTTTLRAIVARSGKRAIAFATKRGEVMEGRRVRPYLPREGEQPIHWRLVESVISSALGQQSMRNERLLIINASRDARSLADVRRNVERLKGKSKGRTADDYMLVGEYLDLVLPEMKALRATDKLELAVGLNVMDLTAAGAQMQALAIRAVIERVNAHERDTLVVFPEAWQFAPRDRNAPAKADAIDLARKGSVLGNFLLCDSQDIAGVDTTIRGAASVWIIGVQREANELKRTLEVVASSGVKPPRPADVATLQVGQFYACWGSRAVKTYVRPEWMSDAEARAVATGGAAAPARPVAAVVLESTPVPAIPPVAAEEDDEEGEDEDEGCPVGDPDCLGDNGDCHWACEPPRSAAADDEDSDESEDDVRTETNKKLDTLIELMTKGAGSAPPAGAQSPTAAGGAPYEEALYERFKRRLLKESPALLKVMFQQPELEVTVEKQTVTADGSSLVGRVALLIARGWLDESKSNSAIVNELGRVGGKTIAPRVSEALAKLKGMGFVTDEGDGWMAVKAMKKAIVQK